MSASAFYPLPPFWTLVSFTLIPKDLQLLFLGLEEPYSHYNLSLVNLFFSLGPSFLYAWEMSAQGLAPLKALDSHLLKNINDSIDKLLIPRIPVAKDRLGQVRLLGYR